MSLWQSIVLGIIQGIGEFLPISSSAHLIIIPYLFNFNLNMTESEKLAFDVALHFGTLMSVLIVYFKDWLKLVGGVFQKVFKKKVLIDNDVKTGILQRAEYKQGRYEVDNLSFRKTHVKKIEVVRCQR